MISERQKDPMRVVGRSRARQHDARFVAVPWRALLGIAVAVACASRVAADERRGQQIYQEKCASCHGERGEGTDDETPLAGDRPIPELARLIAKTMPKGEPEACVAEDAREVAKYIYEAFYSPIAQARLRPPRVELAHLTVRQYQNAVADLLGSFRNEAAGDQRRGLEADYYNDRRFRRDKRQIERLDPQVDFDFGEGSPDEKIGSEEFSIRWQGSLLAPDTGEYEFILQTNNGARLWVNSEDDRRPLIDAWVRSGDDTEFRQTIQLLGGRRYPLRLEFFKFKEKTAAIKLLWRPPHGTPEVIPTRHLSPVEVPETLVVETPFPPDDRSQGYERGTMVSKDWDQATTDAAVEVSTKVVARLQALAGSSDDEQELRAFALAFAERAFRRPLDEAQRERYVDRHFAEAPDAKTAVARVALLVLKSPRFLYREIEGGHDAFNVAARLSFALWDSIPDEPLRNSAAAGELQTREQVLRQAERMVQDRRAKAKLRDFLHQWLKLHELQDVGKDAELYPGFNEALLSDLRRSLDLFLDDVLASEKADFRELLLADTLYLNGRLASFYEADLPADAEFQRVAFAPHERAGVLSHPLLMTGFAYHATSSPIHRGVFLARSLLGRSLKPPADAVTPLPPELHPDLTTRERITLQTSAEACSLCHEMINPLGFSLEHYDAVGRFRTEDNGQPVNASGSYDTATGERVEFVGVRELATFLAHSTETHEAFAEQLFQYAIKQPLPAYGLTELERLRNVFAEQEFNINRLFAEIAVTAAFAEPPPAQ